LNITPIDIRKQEFRRSFRGYDPEEVRVYLDAVASQLEELKHETARAREAAKQLEDRLGHYRLIEQNLQDAALTVQKSLDETRRQSEKEAELILRDAQQQAQANVREMHDHVARLKGDIATLELQRHSHFARQRALLKSQNDFLDAMEADAKVGHP
jgi:cell division initiation protein